MSVRKDSTKRDYLKQKSNPRMRTILDPKVLSQVGFNKRPIRMSDYIAVSAINTYGTWSTKDLIPTVQLAALARFANKLEGR